MHTLFFSACLFLRSGCLWFFLVDILGQAERCYIILYLPAGKMTLNEARDIVAQENKASEGVGVSLLVVGRS